MHEHLLIAEALFFITHNHRRITRVTLLQLLLQMMKVSQSQEYNERERLIPSISKAEVLVNEIEEDDESVTLGSTSQSDLTRPESSEDIPIDSSPLLNRRRPSRWQADAVEATTPVWSIRFSIEKSSSSLRPFFGRSRERSKRAFESSRGDALMIIAANYFLWSRILSIDFTFFY